VKISAALPLEVSCCCSFVRHIHVSNQSGWNCFHTFQHLLFWYSSLLVSNTVC